MSVSAERAPAGLAFRLRARVRLRDAGLLWAALAALAASALAGWIAWDAIPRPHHYAFRALPASARAVGACIVLFAACGFGVTRLFLPAALRTRESLWVLPIGACTSGMALTVLGFLGLPFKLSLALVLAGGVALAAVAIRRRGLGRRPPRELAFPVYLAALLVAVALVPMFSLGYATVTGTGSDAHLAAGTAQFLQHSYPTSVNVAQPVNHMPLVWRSKFPIYYAFGAVAELSGLQTYQALGAIVGVMLGMAALGIYLLAREVLGAGAVGAGLAMSLAALDPIALHTGLNPYFNQTWGYFTLPFALVLAWAVVGPVGSSSDARTAARRYGGGLLLLFLAVGAFAYPLALPIPLIALAVFWVAERRAQAEPVLVLPRLYRGRRSLLWIVPVTLLLAVPAYGVIEKGLSTTQILLPGSSLHSWGGDLPGFLPTYEFFSLGSARGEWVALAVIAGFALVALRARPRPVAWGIGAVIVIGALVGLYFRQRAYGWYFHFKILAFVGPLLVACAAVGMARVRLLGTVAVAGFLATAFVGARHEVLGTGKQLGQPTIDLRAWDRALAPSASLRLDMSPPLQLWGAYFLSGHRLCSLTPLLFTDYPRVPYSRKADYAVVHVLEPRPADALGPALRVNAGYRLYRLSPAVPGPDLCSRKRLVRAVGP